MASSIGKLNPFLYRGYYSDSETGLYYLNSRYYDAQTGRFLNADDTGVLQATQGEILGSNLFAYCNNNPVMCSDPTGCFSVPTWTVATAIDLAMTIANITVQGAFTATSLTFRGLLKWGWSKQLAIKLIKAAVPKIKGFMKAGLTIVRKVMWRIAGVSLYFIQDYAVDKFFGRYQIWNYASIFMSYGSFTAFFLDV